MLIASSSAIYRLRKSSNVFICSVAKKYPPQIHNLVRIADKAGLVLDESVIQSLQELTTFNIKSRYEIIKSAFHRQATKSYTQQWLTRTKQLLDLPKKIN
ncbi:MAG: hypothetical protein ONB44_12420 [candidate division KSB1 bacterium]|nr:hypothetical protein [candidate division KSB1 bacterium]MDZ7302926.1 hypothetical protein [candidate division KSB1 bacterium]MDZ7310501.1 hypothetical protein [candidate division KSB1 bacterium]